MVENENISRIIAALKKVPEKHLLIIELTNRVCLENGQLDYEKLESIQPEVNLAVSEAKMYGSYTMVAVETLKSLPARGNDVGP